MRKKIILIFLVLSLFLGLYLLNTNITGFSTATIEAPVDEEVINEINEKGKASVVVILKDKKEAPKSKGLLTFRVKSKVPKQEVLATLSSKEFKKKNEYSIVEGFSGEITSEGLKKLKQNSNIERVYFNKIYSISLTDSVPLINVSELHPYQIDNQNITGAGETICILDTGVNYTHESLGGCTSLSPECKVIDGYDYVNDDSDPYDDHGHGTHVAGIAAANGNVLGVAPDAKIVMIKVCNSEGSCSSANILSGLDWCAANKDLYNISVISLSLGDNGEYTSANCPADSIDVGLSAAYDTGIFIVAASGNNGYTLGISHPACNENVTSAGAVDKSDVVHYNRGGDLLTILAPGINIVSTSLTGSTTTMSGTSMSAPHIAGAAAILQQYARANSGLLTQPEVETALNSTGKPIYDAASGGTYSRISVYEAVKSLTDSSGPSLNLIAPSNSSYDTNTSLSLSYISNDINDIDSVWYNINGGDNTLLSGDTTFNTIEGSQILNLYSNDSLGNENSVSVHFTTDLTKPVVTLATQNSSYTNNPTTLSFSLTEQNPHTCNLYGSWNDWHLNQTKTASETEFTLNLEDGTYLWNVECEDEAGNSDFANENYTISIDSTLPAITIVLPQNTTYATGTDLELSFSVIESNLDSCWYSIDEGANVIINNCDNVTFNASESAHNLKVFANDSANNENYEEVFFTIDLTSPVVSLESPSDNSFLNSKNVQFQFKATDENLDSCKLYGSWNDWHLNQTKTGITSGSSTTFDQIILEDGNYTWNVECTDSASHSTFNDTNYTLNIDTTQPTLVLSSPTNITYYSSSLDFNFTAVDNNLDSCWYSLNEGSNTTITNCENTTLSTTTDQNNLKAYVKDSANNEIIAETSFVTDTAYPLISLSSPSDDASIESSANFTYAVEDVGIANCSLSINGTINSTDDSITTSATQEFSITLTDDNYYWIVNCVDNGGRENVSEERSVTICTESWNCTDWGSCSDSQQTRTCTDQTSCGTTHSKPTESQSCSSSSDSGSESGSEAGAASSTQISSDEEDEVPSGETPATSATPEEGQEEQREETIEMEELTEGIIEEEKKGLISKAWNMLKNFKEWAMHPKQTATSVSTRAVDGVKNHKIAVSGFVFVISMMIFAQFYFFKKHKINLAKKAAEKIPKPDIKIPPKLKDIHAKFKGVHQNIKEAVKPEIITKPVKKVHKSILKKIDLFKSYRELLKPKNPPQNF